jgi:hypothetical protein
MASSFIPITSLVFQSFLEAKQARLFPVQKANGHPIRGFQCLMPFQHLTLWARYAWPDGPGELESLKEIAVHF